MDNFRKTVLGLLCLVMTACNFTEDTTDCQVDMQLTFRFTKDGQEQFGAQVPSLSVFVFDENDRFAGRWDEADNTKFRTDYTMSMPLPPGTYSFVVWGGLDDPDYYLSTPGHDDGHAHVLTPVAGETTLDDFAVRITRNTRNSFTEQRNFVDHVPGALFFGRTGQRTITSGDDNEVTIDLMKHTQRINLTVVGLPQASTRATSYGHMDITLNSANGSYDFAGGMAHDCQPLHYVQHDADDEGAITQTSTIYTLRTLYDDDHTLSIYNTDTGREFYNADLLRDYIGKVPHYATQEAVDAEDEYDITVDVRSNLTASVTVNGWNVGISGNIIQ